MTPVLIIGALIILYLAWAVYDLQKQVTWLHKQRDIQHKMNQANGEFMTGVIRLLGRSADDEKP